MHADIFMARPTTYRVRRLAIIISGCRSAQLLLALPACPLPRRSSRPANERTALRSIRFDRILLQYFPEQLYDQCARCATAFSNARLTTYTNGIPAELSVFYSLQNECVCNITHHHSSSAKRRALRDIGKTRQNEHSEIANKYKRTRSRAHCRTTGRSTTWCARTAARPLQLSLKSPSSARVFHWRRRACAAVRNVLSSILARTSPRLDGGRRMLLLLGVRAYARADCGSAAAIWRRQRCLARLRQSR